MIDLKLTATTYEYKKLIVGTVEYEKFKADTSMSNVLYFFFKSDECLYIGETRISLFDRVFKHTPGHKEKVWFQQADTIYQMKLDECIDDIAREAIESSFILAYRPRYNKKA